MNAEHKTLGEIALEVLAVAVYLREARDALEPFAAENDGIRRALECVNRSRLKLEELNREIGRRVSN